MRNEGLGSWPERRARMTPGRVAVMFEGRATTYAELGDRVRRLAAVLRERGVAPGDRVAYLGPNHPAFLETFFATATLGAVFVPLNTRLAAPELSYMLDDSGARLLVFGPEHAETVAGLALRDRIAVAGEYEELLAAAPAEPIDVPVSLDDVCMIMYTSGTTGHPKGAMLTHGNLTWNCYNLLVDLDLAGDDVALVSAPLFHTAALNHTALPVFLKGGTNVLVGKFDPAQSFDLIAEHRHHADVRGAGDVPADRALAPLVERGPVVAAHPALRRRAGADAADPHLPGPRADLRAGLRDDGGLAGGAAAAPGRQRAQGRVGRHADVLHRRAGRRPGRHGRRRRRAGRGGGARPERHGRLLAAPGRDRAHPGRRLAALRRRRDGRRRGVPHHRGPDSRT